MLKLETGIDFPVMTEVMLGSDVMERENDGYHNTCALAPHQLRLSPLQEFLQSQCPGTEGGPVIRC